MPTFEVMGLKPMSNSTPFGRRDFAMQRVTEVSEDLKQFGATEFDVLGPLHDEVRLDMPGQLIRTFLLILAKPGLSVSDYATLAGVSKSVMSRHILDLGERNRRMEEGYGLVVARPRPEELRKHEIFLTHKGVAVATRMKAQLDRTYKRR